MEIMNERRWWDLAACQGTDPDLWFPVGKGVPAEIDEAKAICARCPVRESCLTEALETNAVGIWGGLDADERHKLRQAQQERMSA